MIFVPDLRMEYSLQALLRRSHSIPNSNAKPGQVFSAGEAGDRALGSAAARFAGLLDDSRFLVLGDVLLEGFTIFVIGALL